MDDSNQNVNIEKKVTYTVSYKATDTANKSQK